MRRPRLLGAGAQEHRRGTLGQWGGGLILFVFFVLFPLFVFFVLSLRGRDFALFKALSLGCMLESCQSGQFSFRACALG